MTQPEFSSSKKWWKEAVVYQIYPASFKDSNNDGWGDLNGIRSKLPYLKELGVDVIWISPFYDSPQDDMGYDIANYEKVWPVYGTNQNCYDLINEIHRLGMKVLVDLVINHCSDQHKWFKESRSSKTSPKRDWFFWRPPKGYVNGKPIPPNNWGSFFGGSAWKYDPQTKEYYLHLFAPSQPDFNWENNQCRDALFKTSIKFWLNKGVDGFRIDTAGLYSKVPGLPDVPVTNPKLEYQNPDPNTQNGPRIHEFHRMLHDYMKKISGNDELLTIGEVGHASRDTYKLYTSAKRREVSELFIFTHTDVGTSKSFRYNLIPYKLRDLKLSIVDSFSWIEDTDCWSTIYLENHDQPRSVSRFGDEAHPNSSAKLLALMTISFTGTLCIYQGQELGCTNFKATSIDDYEDVDVKGNYDVLTSKFGVDSVEVKKFVKAIALISRDHGRTPFPWNGIGKYAGFSSSEPWFHMNSNFPQINADDENKDPNSVLNYWKLALKIRKKFKNLLIYGYNFQFYQLEDDRLFAYVKEYEDRKMFAALNFSNDPLKFTFPASTKPYIPIFGTQDIKENNILQGWEGRIYMI